jgi:hypothetical protein
VVLTVTTTEHPLDFRVRLRAVCWAVIVEGVNVEERTCAV